MGDAPADWIVSLGTGRTDDADVAAAMDQAASTVMTEIVAFVAKKL